MPQDDFRPNGPRRQPIVTARIVQQPRGESYPSADDVEVIDLDSPGRHIKPTTWH